MYCSKCGKQLNDGSVFCSQCGQRVGGQQPVGTISDNRPAKPRKRGKGIVVTLIILALLIGGAFGGHFLGLYTLPFLTDSVNAVSILRADGTVNIERASDTLAAREGMRLQNLDTIRTGGDSSSWLSLDEVKAVRLSELTALRLDKGTRGFNLALIAGEIKTQIDQPLAANEDFTVQAGNLALAVRGTVFTVNYTNDVVKVNVESGEVAILDEQGKEIDRLGAGESGEYEATPASAAEPAPTPAATANYEVGNIVEFGGYEWRVLELRDGKALLLSEYVLGNKQYNDGPELMNDPSGEPWAGYATTWEQCSLRAYLNGEFLNSFSESERAQIAETYNVNHNNPWFYEFNADENWPPIGGADTIDRVFLLSLEEVVKYFGDSGLLANPPADTIVSTEHGTQINGEMNDEYNEARIAHTPSGNTSSWWLRSPGFLGRDAALVNADGSIYVGGNVLISGGNIRPAMWVKL